jgi:hypothetical protein
VSNWKIGDECKRGWRSIGRRSDKHESNELINKKEDEMKEESGNEISRDNLVSSKIVQTKVVL